MHLYNSKPTKSYKTVIEGNRYNRKPLRRRLYQLYFENPGAIDDFIAKIEAGEIRVEKYYDLTHMQLAINMHILTRMHPDVLVCSILFERKRMRVRELIDASELPKSEVKKALGMLRKRGLIK